MAGSVLGLLKVVAARSVHSVVREGGCCSLLGRRSLDSGHARDLKEELRVVAVAQGAAVAAEPLVGAAHPVPGMAQEEREEKPGGAVASGPGSVALGMAASADPPLGSLGVVVVAGLGLPHGARTGSVAAEEG